MLRACVVLGISAGGAMRKIRLDKGQVSGLLQLLVVVLVIVGALLLSNALKPSSRPAGWQAGGGDARAVTVSLVTPAAVSHRLTVNLTGVVQNRTSTDVAAQVGGRVVDVAPAFRPGGTIAAGGLIFQIERREYELALERTLAEIAGAKSEIELLETEADLALREWREVYPDREPPPLAVKEPQLAAAQARLQSAEAARKAAMLSLERTRVTAPSAVRVLTTKLDRGQIVAPNQVVGTVYAIDTVEVVSAISTQELEAIAPAIGRTATMSRTSDGEGMVSGTVTRVSAALDERTRLSQVFIDPDAREALLVGQFVNVAIEGDEVEDAVQFPASALAGRNLVWVAQDGTLSERRIEVLETSEQFVVAAAFDAADGVVAVPPANAFEGMQIGAGERAAQAELDEFADGR